MSVTFWGVRGSIPAPGATTRRYGGNTPCIEVRCGREIFLFDLGSGVRQFGQAHAQTGKPLRATIFLSHYHYDHLQGLPFFTPLFDERNEFVFYGSPRNGQTLEDILTGQMVPPYFPVTAEMIFRAKVEYRSFLAGQEVEIGEAKIRALELNHPGGNLGYRVEYQGKSMVYATDVEHGSPLDERVYAFAQNTDLLIYDAMYTEAEYEGRFGGSAKTGWGHSTWNAAVKAANAANAKKLVLFHHEPTREDSELDLILKQVRKLRPEAIAAREHLTLLV